MMRILPNNILDFVVFVMLQKLLISAEHVRVLYEVFVGENERRTLDWLGKHFFSEGEEPRVQKDDM